MSPVAYDLDGVLSAPVPKEFFVKPWRHMNGGERNLRLEQLLDWYTRAPVLHVPSEERFHVITARKVTVRTATEAWLGRHFGSRVVSLRMLEVGRTMENVVAFKSAALVASGIEDFTEDNRAIVTALRKLKLHCRIWHYVGGKQVLDYDPGFL